MTLLAFVDIETTGLDPKVHEPWEVALVLRATDGDVQDPRHEWQLPVNLGRADPVALTISRYYERSVVDLLTDPYDFAAEFAKLTHGAHLVGAVPSFDAGFLGPYLRRHGACPGWDYHLVDVEALAAGVIATRSAEDWKPEERLAEPPWSSEYLSRQVDIDPDAYDRHTAMGDVEWAMAIYDAVMGWGRL